MKIFLTLMVFYISWTTVSSAANIKLSRGLVHFEKLKEKDAEGHQRSPDLYDRLSFMKDTTNNRAVEEQITKQQKSSRIILLPNYPQNSISNKGGMYHIEGAGTQDKLPIDIVLNEANSQINSASQKSVKTTTEKNGKLNTTKNEFNTPEEDEIDPSDVRNVKTTITTERKKQISEVEYKIIPTESNFQTAMLSNPTVADTIHLLSKVKISDPIKNVKISSADEKHISGFNGEPQNIYDTKQRSNVIINTVEKPNGSKVLEGNFDKVRSHNSLSEIKLFDKSEAVIDDKNDMGKAEDDKVVSSLFGIDSGSTLSRNTVGSVADALTGSKGTTTTVPIITDTGIDFSSTPFPTIAVSTADDTSTAVPLITETQEVSPQNDTSVKEKSSEAIEESDDRDSEDEVFISEIQKAKNKRKFYDMLAEVKRKLIRNDSSVLLYRKELRFKPQIPKDSSEDLEYDYYSDSASDLDPEESSSSDFYSEGDATFYRRNKPGNQPPGRHKSKAARWKTLSNGDSSDFYSESSEGISDFRKPLKYAKSQSRGKYIDYESSDFFSDSFEDSTYENKHPRQAIHSSNGNYAYSFSSEKTLAQFKRQRPHRRISQVRKPMKNVDSFWSDESDNTYFENYSSSSLEKRKVNKLNSAEDSDLYYARRSTVDSDLYYSRDSSEDSDFYYPRDNTEESDLYYSDTSPEGSNFFSSSSAENSDIYYSSSLEDSYYDVRLKHYESNKNKNGGHRKTLYEDFSRPSNIKRSSDFIDEESYNDNGVKRNRFQSKPPVEKLKISDKRLRGIIRTAFTRKR